MQPYYVLPLRVTLLVFQPYIPRMSSDIYFLTVIYQVPGFVLLQ